MMQVNQEKPDQEMAGEPEDETDKQPEQPSILSDENENQVPMTTRTRTTMVKKNDQSLLEMIKSRPKRLNRKVPSRLRRETTTNITKGSEDEIQRTTEPSSGETDPSNEKENSKVKLDSIDSGLDSFFQSISSTFKKRTFASQPLEEAFKTRPSSLVFKSELAETQSKFTGDKNTDPGGHSTEDGDGDEDNRNRLAPMSIADRIARSRSSPNLIDPRKMMLPGDPRVNLSLIKELRARKQSSETTNESTTVNNSTSLQSSLLSELRTKNKPFGCRKESASSSSSSGSVSKDKPPILNLKPSLTSLSSSFLSSSSSSSTLTPISTAKASLSPTTTRSASDIPSSPGSRAHQSGHFFNVKLRETKKTNHESQRSVNNLIKSYTRASFPPFKGETPQTKRRSEPIGGEDNDNKGEKDDDKDGVAGGGSGEDDPGGRSRKEASALDAAAAAAAAAVGDQHEDENEDERRNDRSSEESSEEENEDDEDEDEEEDNDEGEEGCHKNGAKPSTTELRCPDDRRKKRSIQGAKKDN